MNATILPLLNPDEHARLEAIAGHPMTNDEAQLFRHESLMMAATWDWIEAREAMHKRPDRADHT